MNDREDRGLVEKLRAWAKQQGINSPMHEAADRIKALEKALREIAVATRTHATVSYWTDVEVEMLKDIAREALGEGKP